MWTRGEKIATRLGALLDPDRTNRDFEDEARWSGGLIAFARIGGQEEFAVEQREELAKLRQGIEVPADDGDKGVLLLQMLLAVVVQSTFPPIIRGERDNIVLAEFCLRGSERDVRSALHWDPTIVDFLQSVRRLLDDCKTRFRILTKAAEDHRFMTLEQYDKWEPPTIQVARNWEDADLSFWRTFVAAMPKLVGTTTAEAERLAREIEELERPSMTRLSSPLLISGVVVTGVAFLSGFVAPVIGGNIPWEIYALIPSIIYLSILLTAIKVSWNWRT